MDIDEKKDKLNKLKLGDRVWLPAEKPLFPNDGFYYEDPCLIAEIIEQNDGEFTREPIVSGTGPKILSPMLYEFAGKFKSDESFQQIWFFRPQNGSRTEHDTCWYRNEVWNDLYGKHNVQSANLSFMLSSRTKIKCLDEICFDEAECAEFCKSENKKKFDAKQLTKGLRKLQKIAKEYEKSLSEKASSDAMLN